MAPDLERRSKRRCAIPSSPNPGPLAETLAPTINSVEPASIDPPSTPALAPVLPVPESPPRANPTATSDSEESPAAERHAPPDPPENRALRERPASAHSRKLDIEFKTFQIKDPMFKRRACGSRYH
eukprot:s3479_g11.t1